MQRIIDGVLRFQREDVPRHREFFARAAARTQRPQALFITCSDSRVNPARSPPPNRATSFWFGMPGTSDVMAATHLPVLAVKHYGRRMSLRDVLTSARFWSGPDPKTG